MKGIMFGRINGPSLVDYFTMDMLTLPTLQRDIIWQFIKYISLRGIINQSITIALIRDNVSGTWIG